MFSFLWENLCIWMDLAKIVLALEILSSINQFDSFSRSPSIIFLDNPYFSIWNKLTLIFCWWSNMIMKTVIGPPPPTYPSVSEVLSREGLDLGFITVIITVLASQLSSKMNINSFSKCKISPPTCPYPWKSDKTAIRGSLRNCQMH